MSLSYPRFLSFFTNESPFSDFVFPFYLIFQAILALQLIPHSYLQFPFSMQTGQKTMEFCYHKWAEELVLVAETGLSLEILFSHASPQNIYIHICERSLLSYAEKWQNLFKYKYRWLCDSLFRYKVRPLALIRLHWKKHLIYDNQRK